MPSTVLHQTTAHVAIIMDGNGRWAQSRGLPREAGHHAGVSALRKVVAAAQARIGTLTVYAFSSDNWSRPKPEVSALMLLLRRFFASELARLVTDGIKLTVIGRRDRLAPDIANLIVTAQQVTATGQRLHLRIALDYSGRDAILTAAADCAARGNLTREAISIALDANEHTPDVDLLIRTSGEQRLSDFLLWECAYAELYFTDCLWPDFGAREFDEALVDFSRRNRRFGTLANRSVQLATNNIASQS